uniref:T cell receptor beta variable 23-1 (non-functional) n=1 Tax=Chlorocebus sabaeus TaxID=60711 RepID=A0A0D9R5W5_CHLSB
MMIISLRRDHVKKVQRGHKKASSLCDVSVTMGTRLLGCAALCLLAAGSFHAEVTQTPGYLVKGKGQKTKMDCTPEKGHTFVYWYQQNQNKEFTFLISFQNEQVLQETELHKKRFSSQCPKNPPCSLEIPSSEPGDTALYLCASSQSTALKCQFLLAHKLVTGPAQEAGDVLGWNGVIESNCSQFKPQWNLTQG